MIITPYPLIFNPILVSFVIFCVIVGIIFYVSLAPFPSILS
jgi:hypothetical protein